VESPDLHAERLAVAAGGPAEARRETAMAGEVLGGEPRREDARATAVRTGSADADDAHGPVVPDTRAEIARAYAPYLIIIAVFALANIGPIKDALAKPPWTVKFGWPGLDIVNAAGKPISSTTYTFGWLPAAGTLMIIAGLITAPILRVGFARALKAYADTYVELRYAVVTVMAVLALAYVMNQSGETN